MSRLDSRPAAAPANEPLDAPGISEAPSTTAPAPTPSPVSKAAEARTAVWEDWREYLQVVVWLVPDVYRHARAKVLGIVALSVIGVSARAGTIGSVILFIDARTKGKPLVLAGIELPTEASAAVYLLWGTIALVFAALTIAASYRANVLNFDIARSYAEIAMLRALRNESIGRQAQLPREMNLDSPDPIAAMLRGDTFRLVRVVMQTLGVLLPLITLVGAIGVLLATNWVLTLFLVPALAAYTIGLAALNRDVLRDAQKRQFARQRMSQDVKRMLETFRVTRFPAGSEPEWLQRYPQKTWHEEVMTAFRGIILARHRVNYLADAFRGVTLLTVLMVFGSLVADQASSWALLLSYLAALGYATTGMGGVSSCVTLANRYIPQVRRYVHFMRMNPEVELPKPDPSRSHRLVLEVPEPRIAGSARRLEAHPGDVIWCVLRGRFRSGALGEMCLALASNDPSEAIRIECETFFLGKVARIPERSLRELIPPIDATGPKLDKRIADFFEALGVRSEFSEKIGSLDTVVTNDIDAELSAGLRTAIRLLPGILARPRIFAINAEVMGPLDDGTRRRILSHLSDRVVLVVSQRDEPLPLPALSGIAVIEGDALVGVGPADWRPKVDWAVGAEAGGESEWGESDDLDLLDELEEGD